MRVATNEVAAADAALCQSMQRKQKKKRKEYVRARQRGELFPPQAGSYVELACVRVLWLRLLHQAGRPVLRRVRISPRLYLCLMADTPH